MGRMKETELCPNCNESIYDCKCSAFVDEYDDCELYEEEDEEDEDDLLDILEDDFYDDDDSEDDYV